MFNIVKLEDILLNKEIKTRFNNVCGIYGIISQNEIILDKQRIYLKDGHNIYIIYKNRRTNVKNIVEILNHHTHN